MINFLLYITSLFLDILVFILNIIFLYFKVGRKQYLKELSKMFRKKAIGVDQTGNGAYLLFLNATMILDDTLALFGNEDETISSVLGKNLLLNNLTIFGNILNQILNIFEKQHSIKSIEKH